MRRAECNKVEHLLLMLLQVRQGSSTNQATQRMGYEADLGQGITRAVMLNVVVYLIRQVRAHLLDTEFCLVFVSARH